MAEKLLNEAKTEIDRQKQRRAEERAHYEQQIEELRSQLSKSKESTPASGVGELGVREDSIAAAISTVGNALQQQAGVFTQIQATLNQQQNFGEIVSLATSQNLIREFHGNEGPEKARVWINELNSTKTLYSWSDAIALNVGKSRLKGAAWKWLLTKSQTIKTFENFKTSFNSTFTYVRSQSKKLKCMMARTQGIRESLQDYFLDKLWLCEGLNFTVEEIRDEVATGLWSKKTARHILSRDYPTTDAILLDLVRFEALNEGRRNRILEQNERSKNERHTAERGKGNAPAAITWRAPEPGNSDAAHGSGSGSGGSRNQTSTSTFKKGDYSKNSSQRESNACYNCDKTGHYARNCPEPKRTFTCHSCGEVGHVASRCRKKEMTLRNNDNSSVQISEIKVISGSSSSEMRGKFIRNVIIGNIRFTALIDMGSTVCTIKATSAIAAGFHINKIKTPLEAFGAHIIESPGIVEENVLLDNLGPREINLRVVPDTAQKYEVILGQPFTELPDLAYSRRGTELIFEDLAGGTTCEPAALKTRVLKDEQLQPGEIKFIDVKIDALELSIPGANNGEKLRSVKKNEYIGTPIMSIEPVKQTECRVKEIVIDEIITDESTTAEQKQELVEILNKYRKCFAKEMGELGKTEAVTMDIELKDDDVNVQSKPYRLNAKDREDLDKVIEEYREAGIITDTTSDFASPAFIIRKKDETARMIVDYRKLNKGTKVMPYPIPNFDDMLEMGMERDYS